MTRLFLILLPPAALLLAAVFGANKVNLALALLVWMVVWWVFEILPLGITALVPIVVLPALDILAVKEVTSHYANSVIYLFLGGFVIARALEKTNLSHRFALHILAVTGRSADGVILGFLVATTFLSMWISNTATAVMMVPIAMSVVSFLEREIGAAARPSMGFFGVVLFLTIAYSASIGGIMTPVGTPPNVVLLGYLDELYGARIEFWKWMIVTMPIAGTVLVGQTFLLKWLYPFSVPINAAFAGFVKSKLRDLGPVSIDQRITLVVFATVCGLWIGKDLIHWCLQFEFLNDTSIAIFGAVLLFLVPRSFSDPSGVLAIADVAKLPWDILLLFGGGMAMAAGLKEVGLIESLAAYLAGMSIAGAYGTVFILAGATLLLTEVMSNVALCIVALPIFLELGFNSGIHPVVMGIPVAACSSMAFSMPISTPPNAVIFGTNLIRMRQMVRAGLLLNLIGFGVVMSIGWWLLQILAPSIAFSPT